MIKSSFSSLIGRFCRWKGSLSHFLTRASATGVVLWLCGLWAGHAAASVFISEFMPANARILTDEDGQFSDWIEIHNSGGTSVELGGYFLTDDSQELTKWAFPPMTLPGGAYLV